MTTDIFFLTILVAWMVIGALAALFMGRRGHSSFSWAVLGCVFGPLVVPLAIAALRRLPEGFPQTVIASQKVRSGADVLIGVDGSDDADAAVRAVANLLGDRLGRVVLASVVDLDTAAANMRGEEAARAERAVKEQATVLRSMYGINAEGVLLAGRPASALAAYARDGGFALLAVGSRGGGASERLFGSAAIELAAGAPVPVMVVASNSPALQAAYSQ